MGISDRDYVKKSSSNFNYNESKGEIELDDKIDLFSIFRKSKNLSSSDLDSEMQSDIQRFNQASKTRHKIKTIEEKLKPKKKFSFFPWIVTCLIILAIGNFIHKKSAFASEEVEVENIVIPSTSVLSLSFDERLANCPLTLIANSKNYYVRLVDVMRGNKTVMTIFIRAKEELSFKIPVGKYKIKYGFGSQWYGEKELFGQAGGYAESEILEFVSDGLNFQGHTISFYKTSDGNLLTKNVSHKHIMNE